MTNVLIVVLIVALIVAVVCDVVRMRQYFDAKYRYIKQAEQRLQARNNLLKEEIYLLIKAYIKDRNYGYTDEEIRRFVIDYFKQYNQ